MILDVEFIEDVQDFDVEFGENIENTAKLEAQIKTLNAQIAELQQDATEAYEAGRKSQYDEFWDNYQDFGNRTHYDECFAGAGWTEKTFKPKYDIVPSSAYMIFRQSNARIDLVKYLNNLGVKLDFSKCTNTIYLFNYSNFTRVGVVDVSSSTASTPLDNVFSYCSYLVTIDKIVPKKGPAGMFGANTFSGCYELVNVTFEGEIDSNGLNLQWSTKLSKASWINIVGCYSTTISGLSMTGSLVSVNKAFETSEGANDGSTSAEWLNLIATRPNVTFNLV